jgi:hypothetical protein
VRLVVHFRGYLNNFTPFGVDVQSVARRPESGPGSHIDIYNGIYQYVREP